MPKQRKPVVVEFASSNYPHEGAKHYFIGTSLDNIMRDTKGGTEFGFAKFSSQRQLDLAEAEKMKLGFYQKGYEAVVQRDCKSYKLLRPTE